MGSLGRHRNRFDVQVVFPDFAFGVKNRSDVELTPDDVLEALEEFCARIRNKGKVPPSADAVGLSGDQPGSTPRVKGSS